MNRLPAQEGAFSPKANARDSRAVMWWALVDQAGALRAFGRRSAAPPEDAPKVDDGGAVLSARV